ncbi:MAG: hypothetical protein NXI15_06455 [Gammaproteobacteria bacterium]|jgi:uncharacterized protein YcfJ|nr:hypothetical protein [Gammaproteobacteria bacterium]
MKSIVKVVGCSLAVLGSGAVAQEQRFSIEVPVVSVSPIVQTVTDKIPQERCWDERVSQRHGGGYRSATGPLLGAVIGGVSAGALADNTGYQGAIATAGALLGASVGRDVSHRRSGRTFYTTQQRCEVDYELREREMITGYRVGYEYDNQVYYTRTRQSPGSTLRLGVTLEPGDY